MFLTKEKFKQLKRTRKIDKNDNPVVRAVEHIKDGNMFRLWSFAWMCCATGTAGISRIIKALDWNPRKVSRVLTALCNEGWAYRVIQNDGFESTYASLWVLPFGQQLQSEYRTSDSWYFNDLPDEIKAAFPKRSASEHHQTNLSDGLDVAEETTRQICLPVLPYANTYQTYLSDGTSLPNHHQTYLSDLYKEVSVEGAILEDPPPVKLPNSRLKNRSKKKPVHTVDGKVCPLGPRTLCTAPGRHPEWEAKQLHRICSRANVDTAKGITSIAPRNPLRGYLSKLGILDRSSADLLAFCEWMFMFDDMLSVFWQLRYLCCAEELGLFALPLPTGKTKLVHLSEDARDDINQLQFDLRRSIVHQDNSMMDRFDKGVQKELSYELEEKERQRLKFKTMVESGEPYQTGYQIMPWLLHRWNICEMISEPYNASFEEQEQAIVEVSRSECMIKEFLSPGQDDKCMQILGMCQADLNGLLQEQQSLNLKKLLIIERWIKPKVSFQRQENYQVPKFRRKSSI